MLGFLINEREAKEIEYLIKREMDEILFDLKDDRIHSIVKSSMKDRYKILFTLFKRVASPAECMKYLPVEQKQIRKSHKKVLKNCFKSVDSKDNS